MAPEPHILKAQDFGNFEPKLKQAFRDAFHFAWDVGPESLEEQARRRDFAAVIAAARAPADVIPTRCREFLEKIHDLQFQLHNYLWPGYRLRDELISVLAAVSLVGDKISRLPAGTFTRTKGSPSSARIGTVWRLLEAELRKARDGIPLPDAAEEVARLRVIGERAFLLICTLMVGLSGRSPSTKNAVNSAAITETLKEIVEALDETLHRLKVHRETCIPPRSDEAPYRAYFERVAEDLGIRGLSPRECEVPPMALARPRDLSTRRARVLEWLSTRDPEFYPLLPSSMRRDHRAPAVVGGRGRSNWVLHGLAAALVLLELVEEVKGSQKQTGKALFKTTVKRVERWIAERAHIGHFYWDATDAPARSLSAPLVDRHMVNGRI